MDRRATTQIVASAAGMSEAASSVDRMHDTDSPTPDLAQLQAAREAATAAVKAHAALGRRNDETPPEDDPQREASDAAHEEWRIEWRRLMQAESDAAIAVHRARQAVAE